MIDGGTLRPGALDADEISTMAQRALPSRFVDIDKGEPGAHAIRSRLVVCETRSLRRGLSLADTLSATPHMRLSG